MKGRDCYLYISRWERSRGKREGNKEGGKGWWGGVGINKADLLTNINLPGYALSIIPGPGSNWSKLIPTRLLWILNNILSPCPFSVAPSCPGPSGWLDAESSPIRRWVLRLFTSMHYKKHIEDNNKCACNDIMTPRPKGLQKCMFHHCPVCVCVWAKQ